MAHVNITDVSVLNNPATFLTPFEFEINFECLHQLQDDLEWKVTYVGDADDTQYDQVLEEVAIGPVYVGNHKFTLQAEPPNPINIKNEDLIGVTVVLITGCYQNQEFIRIGYYLTNAYDPELIQEYDQEHPPNPVDISKVYRDIDWTKPRVTRFAIDWTGCGTIVTLETDDADGKDIMCNNDTFVNGEMDESDVYEEGEHEYCRDGIDLEAYDHDNCHFHGRLQIMEDTVSMDVGMMQGDGIF